MRLVFWQLLQSPHQAPYIRELASRLGAGRVICVFNRPLDSTTRRIGWQGEEPGYGDAEIVYSRGDGERLVKALGSQEGDLNVFSSLATDAGIRAAFQGCVRAGCRVALLSEARDWRGWKGAIRRLDSVRREQRWRSYVSFVLAIGSMARQWYALCGYESGRIFDFCYVVDPSARVSATEHGARPVRIVFIGRLVPGKRVDLLVDAFARIASDTVQFDVIGSGPCEHALRRQVDALKLGGSVSFLGARPNTEVNDLLSATDVLVLPSHWDGWGAVVNEALANGSRVVCSDYCGAADLVRESGFGAVFTEGSLHSLASTLEAVVGKGKVSAAERERIREYGKSFSGPVVADYLLRVVHWTHSGVGTRPIAPWRRSLVEAHPLAKR